MKNEEKNENIPIKLIIFKEVLNFLAKTMYPLIIISIIIMLNPETFKNFINRITSINIFEGTVTLEKQIEEKQEVYTASEIAPLNSKINELEVKIQILLENREKQVDINSTIVRKTSKFVENSKFNILVFYRSEQKLHGKAIIQKLLDLGYSSAGIQTSFSTLKSKHPLGTIYISHNAKAVNIYKSIANIVQNIQKSKSLTIHPSITNLRRGDMQVLLF